MERYQPEKTAVATLENLLLSRKKVTDTQVRKIEKDSWMPSFHLETEKYNITESGKNGVSP